MADFFPELNADVEPFCKTQNEGFATARISMDKIAYICSITAATNSALAYCENNNVLNAQQRGKAMYYGLDAEWNTFDGTAAMTHVLQLSFPQVNVVVINLHLMGVH